jgi:hypothetical protein
VTDEHPGHPERRRGSGSGPSKRRAAPDPLGKRALFWVPVDPSRSVERGRTGGRVPLGKRALYSDAPAGGGSEPAVPSESPIADRGPIVVTCSACGAVTRVGVLDFLLYQLPVAIWLPRGRFDHRMTCPSCRHRVWAGVTLRRK